MATTKGGATVDFTVAGVTYTYNLLSSAANAGLWTVQNVTPTFVQAKAGASPDNDVQPFAEESFSDWTGSMGLYESTDDPGDLSRPFFSSLDTSKPRQLTGAPGGSVSSSLTTHQINAAETRWMWVDSADGPGFVSSRSDTGNYAYWRWNASGYSWDYQRDMNGTPRTGGDSATTNRAVAGSMHKPFLTVQQYGTALWCANATGLTNINIAAAAPAGAGVIGNLVGTVKFFDQLVTFAVNNKNIDVVCYNDSAGDATLTLTQSIQADGTLANNKVKIYGETVLMGAIPLNGILYIFTDKSLYALQWIEATNVFVVDPLIVGNGLFTSNPCVWQNSLFVGSDNQIMQLTPGQPNPQWKQIDATGWVPSPFNGRVTELHPYMQVLAAKVVNLAGNTGVDDSVLLRYTALGSWQFLRQCSNQAASSVSTPALRTQDGTNFPALHYFGTGNYTNDATIFESGQNIRTMVSGAVSANGGIHVTPWRYGTNRTAQKQLLRRRVEVEKSSGTQVYYQTNTENAAANSPSFSIYVGGGSLGTWHPATPAMTTNTTADASSALDSNGTGVLWCEYDGSNGADWHGSTAYPTYRRIRFLYYVPNSSPPSVAAILSDAYQYLEYAFKFYVINTTLKLEINDDDPANPGSMTPPAALITELQRIQAWDYGKSIITVQGPDGIPYTGVITKFLSNLTNIDGSPNPGTTVATVSLTFQSVKLFGLAI